MSFNTSAISIKNLSKHYEIYKSPQDRLKQFILPRICNLITQQRKQYYHEFQALKNISFEVKKGESIGIIGANGSGKSSLLQIICGTLTPSSGTVETDGRIAALLELGSGFNPEFTGLENIHLNASILGLTTDEINSRLPDIIKFADIGEFIEQPIKTYSSGMTVRLAFSIIAHVNADILVIDEALSVGDVFFTQKCIRFLNDFMKNGTVLFVSHDTGAVINLCTKAILLESGELTKIGSPKSVTEYYLSTLCKPDENINEITDKNSKCEVTNEAEINKSNDSEFGIGDAKILSVQLFEGDRLLTSITGGENVSLKICCYSKKDISQPIIGFQFKDRLGQIIFGENSSDTFQNNSQEVFKNSKFEAVFKFQLPMLPIGDYSITAAIAEGVGGDHIQHHWIHDALVLKVITSNVSYGLVGVPMQDVKISVE